MGDAWLGWLAAGVGLALLILLAVAGYAAMGLVLGAAIGLAGRYAITPDARASMDAVLRRTCARRVPFCACEPDRRVNGR